MSLERKGDTLIVEVSDNGIGIMDGRITDPKSLGLIGIRERVLLLGGEALILRKTGRGNLGKSDSSHGRKCEPECIGWELIFSSARWGR